MRQGPVGHRSSSPKSRRTPTARRSRTPNRAGSRSRTNRRSRAPKSPTRSRKPTNPAQPNVTFNFTDSGREAFQEVTRRIAQRGQAQAIGLPGQRRSGSALRPLRRRPRQRSQDAADHQLRREPRRDRRPHRRPDLRRLPRASRKPRTSRPSSQIGALPINLKLISQTPGLGDARHPGAPRRDQGRRHRPDPGRHLPAALLPLPRARSRSIGPRRLRGDLLRPDQTDPDHPDPAGDRGPGADDRGRGRLEHRHLRANKGGGARRAIDVRARSRPATDAGSRRSSTRTSSPC